MATEYNCKLDEQVRVITSGSQENGRDVLGGTHFGFLMSGLPSTNELNNAKYNPTTSHVFNSSLEKRHSGSTVKDRFKIKKKKKSFRLNS